MESEQELKVKETRENMYLDSTPCLPAVHSSSSFFFFLSRWWVVSGENEDQVVLSFIHPPDAN